MKTNDAPDEAELLNRIDQLIGKLVIGAAKDADREELTQLYERRAALMRPAISSRIDELRRR